MIRFSKYVTLIGIPLVIGAVLLLSYIFRLVTLNDLINQSEAHNSILTKAIANAIWPQIADLNRSITENERSAQEDNRQKSQFALNMVSVMLDEPVDDLLEGTKVLKVKIFNLNNTVIYSTDSAEIGERKPSNYHGLIQAKLGLMSTEIEFRENFKVWDGSEIHDRNIVSSYLPVYDDSDTEIEGIIEIYSDVTALYDNLSGSQIRFASMLSAVLIAVFFLVQLLVKRLEKVIAKNIELTVARDSAKKSNLAKSQFLANMSHELRTPLNAIIGYSEIIEEDAIGMESSDTVKDVGKIQSAARHLLHLINEILDLSKIESGQMQIYIEEINVAVFIQDILTLAKPLISNSYNELIYTSECEFDTIRTDALKLRQILINLLGNAAKFCENGKVSVHLASDKEGLHISVADTGIGIPEEQLAHLFQPFVQADDSTTRRFGGTGLGLAITKQYCDMLGGKIDISSQLGKGTTFTIHIPDLENHSPLAELNDLVSGSSTAKSAA